MRDGPAGVVAADALGVAAHQVELGRRRSWPASRPPGRRPGGCRPPARACRRPTRRARRSSAGCSPPRRAARLSACAGRGGVEVELDHLPVALVLVVPVVEDVEEPVLERQLAGLAGLGHDAGVGRGRRLGRQARRPLLVGAARAGARRRGSRGGSRRAPARGRAAVGATFTMLVRVPRAAQRDLVVPHQQVDVRGLVRLADVAGAGLLLQPHDRRVHARQGDLGRGRRARRRPPAPTRARRPGRRRPRPGRAEKPAARSPAALVRRRGAAVRSRRGPSTAPAEGARPPPRPRSGWWLRRPPPSARLLPVIDRARVYARRAGPPRRRVGCEPSVSSGPIIIGYDGSPVADHAIREAAALLGPRPALVVVVWESGAAVRDARRRGDAGGAG